VDSWVVGATATLDEKVRAADYAHAQHWAVEQAAVVPLYVPAYLLAVAKNVRGLAADPAGFPVFYDVSVGA
jgi:peptide/nickel transport system substrate-binding protein